MLVVAGEAPRFCSDGRLAYVLYHSLLWNSYLAPASGLAFVTWAASTYASVEPISACVHVRQRV